MIMATYKNTRNKIMKKTHALLLIAALTFGLSIPCSADQVQGFVESVDASNHSIRIKDPASAEGKTVRVHPKVISEIKTGSVVKATLKSGSDEADTLEVLVVR